MTPPKYLRFLGAGIDPRVALPAGVTAFDVNITLHPVTEALREELPRRYQFPGVGKVYLQLGGPTIPAGLRRGVLGVAQVQWEAFEAETYLRADRAMQQQMLLAAWERGLTEVAALIGADDSVIRDMSTRVRQRRMPLPDLSVEEILRRIGRPTGSTRADA